MKIVGLVTEYNPFHKGHLHHLNASKEKVKASHTIAVMSGQFLQRGEPALLNKWLRAQGAIKSGVDLVIELPTQFACSSAETFAYGSIALLDSLNCVDSLVFGSEAGQLQELDAIADLLNHPTPGFNQSLKTHLDKGLSYPKARALAIDEALKIHHDFQPNNVLGIAYLRALKNLNSPISPQTIQRQQATYMSTDLTGDIASATAIRKKLKEGRLEAISNFVTDQTYSLIEENIQAMVFPEALGHLLLYKIRSMTLEDLSKIHDVKEGLEVKIKKAGQRATDYPSLMALTLSKRYTRTRIQRIFIKILLNIDKDTFKTTQPLYARVLAFNSKGQEILKVMRKSSSIPIITNINKAKLDPKAKDQLQLDILATDVYNLLNTHINNYKGGQDHLTPPFIDK